MSEPTRNPLGDVSVRCSVCGERTPATDVNEDRTRFHLEDGSMIRLPDAGLTDEEIAELNTTFLRCECCQEDHEEKDGCC